jgi:two-component system, cell cycle response regulator DivK
MTVRILCIEDSPMGVQSIQRIAMLLKVDLLVATNCSEATERLNHHPDIILADIKLPDCDGFELIRLMRSALPDVPIVAVTGYTMIGDREKCEEAGCTMVLGKPYEVSELMDILRQLIAAL